MAFAAYRPMSHGCVPLTSTAVRESSWLASPALSLPLKLNMQAVAHGLISCSHISVWMSRPLVFAPPLTTSAQWWYKSSSVQHVNRGHIELTSQPLLHFSLTFAVVLLFSAHRTSRHSFTGGSTLCTAGSVATCGANILHEHWFESRLLRF